MSHTHTPIVKREKNIVIQAANTASSDDLYKKINSLEDLPVLKKPHEFPFKFNFEDIKVKLKLYKMDEEGMQEKEKQSERLKGEIRKNQVLLNTCLYETVYVNFIPEETRDVTVIACAEHLAEMVSCYIRDQDIWDSKFISCSGMYITLDTVSMFFNIEKSFFILFTDSTYETSITSADEIVEKLKDNKNFFILKLVLSHFLIHFNELSD
jgi:hypothetical protein